MIEFSSTLILFKEWKRIKRTRKRGHTILKSFLNTVFFVEFCINSKEIPNNDDKSEKDSLCLIMGIEPYT